MTHLIVIKKIAELHWELGVFIGWESLLPVSLRTFAQAIGVDESDLVRRNSSLSSSIGIADGDGRRIENIRSPEDATEFSGTHVLYSGTTGDISAHAHDKELLSLIDIISIPFFFSDGNGRIRW